MTPFQPRRRRFHSAAGVSLIELLIAITITGIIVVPLTGAIFFGFRTTSATETRLEQSNKANLLASFFGPDVQSASTVATGVPEDAAVCGSSATTVDLLLTTEPGVSSISYYRVTTGTGQTAATVLYRRSCKNGVASGRLAVTQRFGTPPAATPNNPFSTIACGQSCTTVQVALTQQDSAGRNTYPTNLQATLRVN